MAYRFFLLRLLLLLLLPSLAQVRHKQCATKAIASKTAKHRPPALCGWPLLLP